MTLDTTTVRVLIADDSPVARELLVSILQTTPGLQVIGTARNGAEAVRLANRLRPDVITMDVHMPEMDGFEAARQIMNQAPCPIVIITNGIGKDEQELTFSALQAGALSVIKKPTMYDPPEVLDALAIEVKLMSEVKVVRRWDRALAADNKPQSPAKAVALRRNGKSTIQLVVVASSTGGPATLVEIFKQLPPDFPLPILVVQHITPGFGAGLSAWLNQQTALDVRLARHAQEPQPGQVLIAPDDYHMMINGMGLTTLSKEPAIHGLRPAADLLFSSVARTFGATAIGVILSGMGGDGARGLQAMRQTGAHTIAQDKATCVVFGMPAVAIELGAVEQVLPAQRIAAAIMALI